MWPQKGRVEGEHHLPWPAGHAIINAPHYTIDFLGHQGTLLAHGLPWTIYQDKKEQSSFWACQPPNCTDACGYSSPGVQLYIRSCLNC